MEGIECSAAESGNINEMATSFHADIVKVSTLGSAGFTSLVNRKLDGEDIVKMTRRMKGRARAEFIGYVEILSQNDQIMCNCGKLAKMKTDSDGMKAFVGTSCVTSSPCIFVIGKVASQQTAKSISAPQIPVMQSTESLTVLNSALKPPNLNPSRTKMSHSLSTPSNVQSKPPLARKDRPAVSDIALPRTHRSSSAIVTRTGLYVTITDSGLRVGPLNPENAKLKKPSKPRGRQVPGTITSTSGVNNTALPQVSSSAKLLSKSKNGHESHNSLPESQNIHDLLPNADLTDSHFLDLVKDFESKMHEMGLTSVDQLLDRGAVSQAPSTGLLDSDIFNFAEFFNCTSGSQNYFLDGNFGNSMNFLDVPNSLSQSSLDFAGLSTSIPQQSYSNVFSQLPMDTQYAYPTSESSRSRRSSTLDSAFMDILSGDAMFTNSAPAVDIFSTDNVLDNMMTNCDLESLDGSTVSGMQPDEFNPFHQQSQLPFSQQNLLSSWIPSLPYPHAFRESALSSPPSSISSRTTIGSTLSNVSAQAITTASSSVTAVSAPKRKRTVGQTLVHEKLSDQKKNPPTPRLRTVVTTKPSTGVSSASSSKLPAASAIPRSQSVASTTAPTLPRTRTLISTPSHRNLAAKNSPLGSSPHLAFGSSMISPGSRNAVPRVVTSRVSSDHLARTARASGTRYSSPNIRVPLKTPPPVVVASVIPPPLPTVAAEMAPPPLLASLPLIVDDMLADEVMKESTDSNTHVSVIDKNVAANPTAESNLFDSLFDFTMDMDNIQHDLSKSAVALVAEGTLVEHDASFSGDWLF
ncbi:hypothetical protein HK100_006144 [Physocladia obscura]|uniref:Uncharacterized protein n=1 Tax=Physocladia obscura TaxID=109957 RepID=A0AAD5T6E8_9FUNG|nr:hypothetical protein HK100_006144 [Physocladia obscura]